MKDRFFSMLSATAVGFLAIGLAGCTDATPAEPAADELSPSFAAHAERTEVNQGLAAVRAATARYQRVEAAVQDGYVGDDHCVANPAGPGAMGFHYINESLVDATVEVDKPEVLVYAPWRDGELRLVAVEWVVPLPLAAEAPELMGQHFHPNEAVGIWGLHAWIWQHNPDGVFADFNPRISCDSDNPA